MKKTLSLILLFCFTMLSANSFAQDDKQNERRRERFEKFKAEREAFITQAMELTSDEAKAFWPLCDELQMKKFELNKTLRTEMRKWREARKEGKSLSEQECKKLVELSAETKLKEAQLEKEYIAKFLGVIPAEKVLKYQRAEQEFAKKMSENRHKNRREK